MTSLVRITPQSMNSESSYIRLTKLCEIPESSRLEQWKAAAALVSEVSRQGRLCTGYVMDGWFLEEPCVGRSMVMLRFRRNGIDRLGLFTSSLVTYVGVSEIHTENSVYQLEHCALPLGSE